MLAFVKRHIALITGATALFVSSCTSLGLSPLPNPYEGTQSNVERALVTIKSFGAAQDVLFTVCSDEVAGTPEADVCVGLITAEQTLRPAVTAAGQIGAEYGDINFRINQAGTNASADWLAIAAEAAGRMAIVYEPVKQDVEEFITGVQDLTD